MAPIILRSDSATTEHLAVREDVNHDVAGLLLLTASTASMGAVSIVLHFTRNEAGAGRTLLVAMAAITLVVSWTVLNTQFTLRNAHLYYMEPPTAWTSVAPWPSRRTIATSPIWPLSSA